MKHNEEFLRINSKARKVSKGTLFNHPEWSNIHTMTAAKYIMGWKKAKDLDEEQRSLIGDDYNIHAHYAWEENYLRCKNTPDQENPTKKDKAFGWYIKAHGDWNPTEDDFRCFELVDKILEKGLCFDLQLTQRISIARFYKENTVFEHRHKDRRVAICFACLKATDLESFFLV